MRAHDRYGLKLVRADLRNICEMIQENKGEFIHQQENKNTLWWLDYNGTRVKVVISADFYSVITFLPPFTKSEKAAQRKARKKEKKRRVKAVYRQGKRVLGSAAA